jgi:hypothetical protein
MFFYRSTTTYRSPDAGSPIYWIYATSTAAGSCPLAARSGVAVPTVTALAAPLVVVVWVCPGDDPTWVVVPVPTKSVVAFTVNVCVWTVLVQVWV